MFIYKQLINELNWKVPVSVALTLKLFKIFHTRATGNFELNALRSYVHMSSQRRTKASISYLDSSYLVSGKVKFVYVIFFSLITSESS